MNDSNDLSALLQGDWEALVGSLPAQLERSPVVLPLQQRLPLRPAALFAELEDVLRVLNELRGPLVKHASRYINGAWTLRQLLAHLASWAREFRHQVETVARGKSPGARDFARGAPSRAGAHINAPALAAGRDSAKGRNPSV